MSKINYKDIRVALTETVLLSFLLWTLDKFLFPGVFSKNNFIKIFRDFRGHVHLFICSVLSCSSEAAVPKCLKKVFLRTS